MRFSLRFSRTIKISISAILLLAGSLNTSGQERQNTPQGPAPRRGRMQRRVEGYYKSRITPHWFADNKCFWYRNDLSEEKREFILVNAETGERRQEQFASVSLTS